MLKSIAQVAVGFIENQDQDVAKGKISVEAAKQNSIDVLRGYPSREENKDYFWSNDFQPKMVMHPYRNDLEGSDLSKYSDPEGKFLFQEYVKVSIESGEGYISYRRQAKNDAERIIPKLSYVREFKPWGWVIGTGIYMEDIKAELNGIYRQIIVVSGMNMKSKLKKHNGYITVISTPGNGTTFFVYLPIQKPGEIISIGTGNESVSDIAIKSANILIMDDDEQVCAVTQKMIKRFGFIGSLAPDGLKAISMFESSIKNNSRFDLIQWT